MSAKNKEDKNFYVNVCAKLRQIGKKIDLIKKTTELTESISSEVKNKDKDD